MKVRRVPKKMPASNPMVRKTRIEIEEKKRCKTYPSKAQETVLTRKTIVKERPLFI
jgi:hypothetical protein